MAGGDLGKGARLAAQQRAWICLEDEAGQTFAPGPGPGATRCRPYLYYGLVVHRGPRVRWSYRTWTEPQMRTALVNGIRLMSEIFTGLFRLLAWTILPLPM